MFRGPLLATAAVAALMTHHPDVFAARVVDDSRTVQVRGNLAPQLGAAVVGRTEIKLADAVANFSFAPASPVVGQTVQFTDSSTGSPISWLWAFGDGGFSVSQSPTHTFTSPGTFTVSLAASYSFPLGSSSTSRSVTVLAAGDAVANFSFTPASPVVGQTVQFTDTSTGSPISWLWAFGDNESSVSQNPTHTFTSPGTFTVTLTASYSSPLGSSSKSEFIQVTSTPTQGFTYVLPSSAHSAGANGAFYTTDLSITNRGTTDANLMLQFLGHDQDGTAGPKQDRGLAANQAVNYADVLASVFGVSATDAQNYGAILITADSSSLKIVSQTSTPPPNGLGTFGQSVPAQGANDFVTPASPKSLTSLRDDTAFRTNAFFANATTSSVTVTLTLLAADGSTLGTTTRTLPPLGMTQISSVVTALGAPAGTRDAALVVSTTTSGAQIVCYASVIDNVTNDPRTILP
jgi:PKD repeat protein